MLNLQNSTNWYQKPNVETLNINPQLITDDVGHDIGVFLPMQEFEKLLEELVGGLSRY